LVIKEKGYNETPMGKCLRANNNLLFGMARKYALFVGEAMIKVYCEKMYFDNEGLQE